MSAGKFVINTSLIALLPTKRACGQVGNLKRCCPNVRRYKLLIGVARAIELLTYQCSKGLHQPKQNGAAAADRTGGPASPVRYNKITDRGRPCGSITSVRPHGRPRHLPQTHVGCCAFFAL